MKIKITVLTEKGLNAITEHISSMTAKDRVTFKLIGIRQYITKGKNTVLNLDFTNKAFRILENLTPQYKKKLEEKISRFRKDHLDPFMKKHGAEEEIDYFVEVG